jgi:hypothetical protein
VNIVQIFQCIAPILKRSPRGQVKEFENGTFHQTSSEFSIVLVLVISLSELALNDIIAEHFDPITTAVDLGIVTNYVVRSSHFPNNVLELSNCL